MNSKKNLNVLGRAIACKMNWVEPVSKKYSKSIKSIRQISQYLISDELKMTMNQI
jgi:hypothetical protein